MITRYASGTELDLSGVVVVVPGVAGLRVGCWNCLFSGQASVFLACVRHEF
jgi:hypothetical protein